MDRKRKPEEDVAYLVNPDEQMYDYSVKYTDDRKIVMFAVKSSRVIWGPEFLGTMAAFIQANSDIANDLLNEEEGVIDPSLYDIEFN